MKKRKKSTRMSFLKESHLYTGQLRMKHQKWQWGIWYPCFPSHISHYTYQLGAIIFSVPFSSLIQH